MDRKKIKPVMRDQWNMNRKFNFVEENILKYQDFAGN